MRAIPPAGMGRIGSGAQALLGMVMAGLTGHAIAQNLPGAADRGPLDLVLSHEQSRGLYGERTATRIRQTALTLRYRGQGWSAEVQLPWLEIDSAGSQGGLPDGAQPGRASERGLGDIWLKAGLGLRDADAAGPGIDLVAKLKTRSGDAARGLGSGGTDLAWQIEALQPVGLATLFGHVGWRHTGDVPGYRPYRNPWYGQLGLLHAPSPALELGAYAEAREPIGRLGALGEATVYAAWRQDRQRWQAYVTRGWRDASADWALGLSWRVRY